jgi:TonB family protein
LQVAIVLKSVIRNLESIGTEVLMKKCNSCQEEFADKFKFCPTDGTRLSDLRRIEETRAQTEVCATRVLHLTMIESVGLPARLLREASFAWQQVRRLWPEFKQDPIAVVQLEFKNAARRMKRLAEPNTLVGTTIALVVLVTASLLLVFVGPRRATDGSAVDAPDLAELISLDVPSPASSPEGSGDGVGSNGRVGLNHGKREGSAPEPKHSRGGGGSGDLQPQPANIGNVPPPSNIPAPINPPLPTPSLAVAGVDLDPALWRNLRFASYGDPHSKSAVTSKGPGTGGAIGNGNGFGNGPGDGNGVGPGERGNMGGGSNERGCCGSGGSDGTKTNAANTIYRVHEVTQRARLISKPEPQYTEAARKNQVTGSVVLSVIFSESGQITNIRAVKTLPDGLTEKAIAAARQIRFIPAMRNGQSVSVYMNLEYNFNLY